MSAFCLLLFVTVLPFVWAGSGQALCDTDRRLCVTGLCPIEECLKCDKDAICTTSNPKKVIPGKLWNKTRTLELTYFGPEAELNPEMFHNLYLLHEVTIRGNIRSIAPKTFAAQQFMTYLTISNSNLSSLPNELFNNKNRLARLILPYNQFTEIPVSIFPNILKIQRLDFSHNPIISCRNENDTISTEFENLPDLSDVRLAGYGHSKEMCSKINKDYLHPLRNIRNLDLSESLLFYSDQRILSTLTNLQQLTLHNLEPYKFCPKSATDLFKNMPPKLNTLKMQFWASTSHANDSCKLDEVALSGLKQLKKLSTWDVRFGDKIFGNTLSSSLMAGFDRLRVFYIHWCGIAMMESGTFNAVSLIADMGLEGNLLGPRKLELYTGEQTPGLRQLNLASIGITNVKYDASNILTSFPKLNLLVLDDNYLDDIPDFGLSRNITSKLYSLTLNNNNIKTLTMDDGEKVCKVMTNLVRLKMELNQLTDITGVSACPHIELLELANNLIGVNQHANFQAISKLLQLDHLDLKENKIKYLTSTLFTNLDQLRTLILANNEITFLSNDVFTHTPRLSFLDLSANLLPVFNTSMVSTGLTQLVALYLQANQISYLSPELLNYISTRLIKIKRIGLVGNPLTCSCDSYLSDWVRNSSVIMQVKNLTCRAPNNEKMVTNVLSYKPNFFECKVKLPLLISLEVLAGVVVAVLVTLPCYKYRWYIRHPRVVVRAVRERLNQVQFEQKCEYDAFISYDSNSENDMRWLTESLLPNVEKLTQDHHAGKPERVKLYVVDRDSAVGSLKHTERCRAIGTSRKVIILLSNSYLGSPSCLSEADLVAGYEKLDGEDCYQPNRILVIVLEDLTEEAIKPPVTALLTENVAQVGDGEERMKRLWQRVNKFISKPEYIYRKKNSKKVQRRVVPALTNDGMSDVEPLIS